MDGKHRGGVNKMRLRVPPATNVLLAAIGASDLQAIAPHLEPVELAQGAILIEAGAPFRRLCFPLDSVVSIVCEFADGTVAEMASVGREGVIGAGALSDGDAAIARYEVQFSGRALAIDEGFFRKAAQTHPGLRAVCFEYLQAFHGQVLQSVACNSVHSLEERYARWLLTTHDRLPGDTFPLTQEILAGVLGVHRPTVSLAARKLQNAGLIRYNRGEITLLDREGLENVACDCYRIICDHYERRLPAAYCQPAASEK